MSLTIQRYKEIDLPDLPQMEQQESWNIETGKGRVALLPYLRGFHDPAAPTTYFPERWQLVWYDSSQVWHTITTLDASQVPSEYEEWPSYGAFFVTLDDPSVIGLEKSVSLNPTSFETLLRVAQAPIYPSDVALHIYPDNPKALTAEIMRFASRSHPDAFFPVAQGLQKAGALPMLNAPINRILGEAQRKNFPNFLKHPYWHYGAMVRLLTLPKQDGSLIKFADIYRFASKHQIPFHVELFQAFLTMLAVSPAELKKIDGIDTTRVNNMLSVLSLIDLERKIQNPEAYNFMIPGVPSLFPWPISPYMRKFSATALGEHSPVYKKKTKFERQIYKLYKQGVLVDYITSWLNRSCNVMLYVFRNMSMDETSGQTVLKSAFNKRPILMPFMKEDRILHILGAFDAGLIEFIDLITTDDRISQETIKQIHQQAREVQILFRRQLREGFGWQIPQRESGPVIGSNFRATASGLVRTVNNAGGYIPPKTGRVRLARGGAFK